MKAIPSLESILSRETAAIAQTMTSVEREDPDALKLVEQLKERTGGARRVVVTGPPGVGKSSLLREVMRLLRERGETVGVLACDPASPHTHGAFLGDRVRWSELGGDADIFVRSVAHRAESEFLPEVVWRFADLLDASGFSWVLIETVGVGQTCTADSRRRAVRVLVLSPGSGDEIQMLKAGFLEDGDLYVVNKADLPGGLRWARQLEETLSLNQARPPRVLATVATTGEGVAELVEELSNQ